MKNDNSQDGGGKPGMSTTPTWNNFNPNLGSNQMLPQKYQPVLVLVPEKKEKGLPHAVAVGYLKFGAGDLQSPYFVTPGVGGDVRAWCDCLPWREINGRNAVYEIWKQAIEAEAKP